MFITQDNLRGLDADARARVARPATHTPPLTPLPGIYSDVEAVIGQVSGVELSDNRLVTVAAHE